MPTASDIRKCWGDKVKLAIMKNGIIFILCVFILSCQNQTESIDDRDTYELSVRSNNLETLGEDISSAWLDAFDAYGMQVICGCECEDIVKIPDIWITIRDHFPSLISDENINISSCADLKVAYKTECNFDCRVNLANHLTTLVDDVSFMAPIEKDFIKNHILDPGILVIDRIALVDGWEAMSGSYVDGYNGEFSLALVKVVLSILEFHDEHEALFTDQPGDDPQAFWHIYGAVAGGVGGVAADCIEDVYCDTGYGDVDVWGDFGSSFLKGAALGFITSV